MKQYSETQFRRFEPFLKEILLAWPAPYCHSPGDDEPGAESWANQLRDAIRGLCNNNWKHDLDWDKWLEFISSFKVSVKNGTVIVGPRDYGIAAGKKANPRTTQFDAILDNPPDEVVISAAVLVHYGHLSVIRVRSKTKDLLAKLPGIYKLSVVKDIQGSEDGWHIMCR